MKIAFLIYPGAVFSGKSNGIRSQALTWKSTLEEKGHKIDLINNWGDYNWMTYDAIHIFGYDISVDYFVSELVKKNPHVFLSPIIDSNKSHFLYRLASYNGIKLLRLYSINYALRKALKKVRGVCVRSNHEMIYINYSLGISQKYIFRIPLTYNFQRPKDINNILMDKESFCLHVSSIYQPRKNVLRLIEAAKKYNFRLILAGNKGSKEEFEPIKKCIGDSSNIEVLGFIDEPTLRDLYKRAKVFALPSLREGVGIVALDAANYGCNIVITNIGGPKEYYSDCPQNARLVNPFSIDDIGKAIVELLQTPNSDNLILHLEKNYSKAKLIQNLEQMYSR